MTTLIGCQLKCQNLFSNLKTIVRHGHGGGGRPLRNPSFNWKEKRILGITDFDPSQRKKYKIKPYGKLDHLKSLFNEKTNDIVLPFDGKDKDFHEESMAKASVQESNKKVIQVSKLFGSHKTTGLIPFKKGGIKLRYDYERVFGEKHRRLAEEKKQAEASANQ